MQALSRLWSCMHKSFFPFGAYPVSVHFAAASLAAGLGTAFFKLDASQSIIPTSIMSGKALQAFLVKARFLYKNL